MKTALRSIAFTLAATASLAACSNDSKEIGDVLAEDSTLAREVLSARGDTLGQPIDTALPEEVVPEPVAPVEIADAAPSIPPSASAPRTIPSAPTSLTPEPSQTTRARHSSRARPHRIVRSRIDDVVTPSSRRSASPAPRSRNVEATSMRGSALLPAGLELSLASDQRICASMARIGDRFSTHLDEDVIGPIGVVIPKGTPAVARVVSTKGDIDLVVESFTLTSRDYSPESLVTHTETEKVGYTRRTTRNAAAGAGLGAAIGAVAGGGVQGALIGAAGGAAVGTIASRSKTQKDLCIPAGGDITARLVEPLKIAL